jgi:hypothetical protein
VLSVLIISLIYIYIYIYIYMGSDSCTHSTQQVHNSKTQWSGAQCVGPTSLCLAIVHLLYTVSILSFSIYIYIWKMTLT